ncbi:hypothetical protein HPB50_005048 [Hyalomma asiaticum]|uniref:Uncharacterized protein n=1 Tax=Hyalomma asiaticum TaxID=266040 RepID=A0ACB7RR67_HYAAI|nr:hypothetical protein HPB50_005048 [Hyalomma asiaticum]
MSYAAALHDNPLCQHHPYSRVSTRCIVSKQPCRHDRRPRPRSGHLSHRRTISSITKRHDPPPREEPPSRRPNFRRPDASRNIDRRPLCFLSWLRIARQCCYRDAYRTLLPWSDCRRTKYGYMPRRDEAPQQGPPVSRFDYLRTPDGDLAYPAS